MVNVKFRLGTWRRMLDLLQSQKYWMDQIADDFDLTAQMAWALHEILRSGSMTMKEIAGRLSCDASNVTGLVDRLEARGFVERQPSESDRRVKCVVLTNAGRRLSRKMDERLAQPPPAIAALTESDQESLAAILGRALENAQRQREERKD